MKLSVIIPVFNEVDTILEIVERVRRVPIEKELVLVDDSSSDGSGEILSHLGSDADTTVLTHPVNSGKGAAIASGLSAARGDVGVIQDAALEYDPNDFLKLIDPIEKGVSDVVYGVRDLSSQRMIMRAGNRLLTWIAGMLFGVRLQDMETCYKMMTRSVYQLLALECRRFDVEAEITAKILRSGFSIYECPIQYNARYDNKKLSPLDGLPTLIALMKYRFFS
ncbi:MAG: glycosyltransferase family 2 protein [Anaerolineales bacterium]|nr:glycosyltransferase family 2 protein [Anaerolineales bacterium]